VWHFVDSIDFPDAIELMDSQSIIIFNNFMDSVLVSRDASGSHFINSFRLKIDYGNRNIARNLGFSNVTKWVDLVVQGGLKYLCLHLDDDDLIDQKPILPISILSCKTLVSLDLARFRVKGFTFSGFPSLNQLHLYKIVFQQDRDFMLLLAGCPNLEDLQATNIDFYDGNSFTIQEFESVNLPKLISAVITQFWCLCFPLKALSNSEYLCLEMSMLCTKDHEVYHYEVCVLLNIMHGYLQSNLYNTIP
jgi:hypothetical protein